MLCPEAAFVLGFDHKAVNYCLNDGNLCSQTFNRVVHGPSGSLWTEILAPGIIHFRTAGRFGGRGTEQVSADFHEALLKYREAFVKSVIKEASPLIMQVQENENKAVQNLTQNLMQQGIAATQAASSSASKRIEELTQSAMKTALTASEQWRA